MTLFYTSSDEKAVLTALAQINSNCGWPNATVSSWDIVRQAYEQQLYYISMPPENGYTYQNGVNIPQSVMINNVTGVTIGPSNSSWWPPFPPAFLLH